jgi:hypothetical protein
MKLAFFAIVGLVLQGVGLTAFIVVSRSSFASLGEPVVIGVAGLAVCALLWEGVRKSKGLLALCPLPVLLALGYDVAFHLLGVMGFPGLLSDASQPWLDYFLSVLHVTGILIVAYGLVTALFFALSRGFRKTTLHGSGHDPKSGLA